MEGEQRSDLKDQDQRQAVAELDLALFVAEDDHSRNAADGAAENGNNKEHGLRNTESALHRAYLINDHCGKADQVHDDKIEYEHCSCVHELLLSKIPEVYCISFRGDMQEENRSELKTCALQAYPAHQTLFFKRGMPSALTFILAEVGYSWGKISVWLVYALVEYIGMKIFLNPSYVSIGQAILPDPLYLRKASANLIYS